MKTKRITKLIKTLPITGCVWLLSACNGGMDTSSNHGGGGDTVGASSGNGIWNYSVAADYYYGTQNPVESPSLKYDVTVAYKQSLQFVFPVISTLMVPATTYPSLPSVNNITSANFITSCTANEKPPGNQIMNYYALPQLNDYLLSTGTILGTCVAGTSVTQYYSSFISHVVPVVELNSDFTAALGKEPLAAIAIADNVASIINADSNAYGVAFDNEPLISKEGGNTTTTAGTALERAFYGELAYQLSLAKPAPKYLFLYDAAPTAEYLYNSVYQGKTLTNIIIEQNLYDLDTTNPDQSAGPVNLNNYTTLVDGEVRKDLSPELSNAPPIRFMVPASATSTMWDYLQGYNILASGTTFVNPSTLTVSSLCESANATTMGTIDNKALSNFICTTNTNCPTSYAAAQPIIVIFLNSSNCINYTNPDHMYEYFNAALSTITTESAMSNPRFKGTDLYAWRIDAYSDINGSKGYYNQYGDPAESTVQIFPPNITPMIWESFVTWNTLND